MRIGFDAPEFLWLLCLLPLFWVAAYRRRGLGVVHATVAIGLRSLVLLAIVAAIAGVQIRWHSDRVAVMYLLDQSESIDAGRRREMFDFVAANVRAHRHASRDDLAGVILFGREATIEVPPFSDDLPQRSQFSDGSLRTDATNLEQALQLARTAMPTDVRRRIVILTDGNQTLGQAARIADRIAADGIGIDIVPVPTQSGSDVLVEKLDMPAQIRRGQPIEARVVMTNFAAENSDAPVAGRLQVTRRSGHDDQMILNQPIQLTPGKNVFPLRHTIDRAAPYTYTATFVPDDPADDARSQNNRAVAFANVRGQSRVLLIEPATEPGAWEEFADRLREENIEVVVEPSDATFSSLAQLQAYDSVILANVPRVGGDAADSLQWFNDDQIEILVRNTQQLGAGLLMIGGPDALGVGGWTGTALEKAMPVDFEIKNLKVAAVGALALVIDSSGSMDGQKMQLCKAAASEAIKMLGPSDHLGIWTFDGATREVIPMQPVAGRTHMLPMVSRITAGGGTVMYPAMERAFIGLSQTEAAVKHMIVLTDGHTTPNDFGPLTRRMKQQGITVSSVAIGKDADLALMREIASIGSGKMYHVHSPRGIPRIVMRETRRVSRPLIFEQPAGVQPQLAQDHPLIQGVGSPPPIRGYVMTTAKDSPLAQVLMSAAGPQNSQQPVLAVWQYGLGRTAVLTTDGGQRWASDWRTWDDRKKLIAQLMRWLNRPAGDAGKFTLATVVNDGQVQVIVNALDESDQYLNFLEMGASVLDPDLEPIDLRMRQTAPGRYVGSFPVDRAGNYFVHVVPEAGSAPLTTGVSVPFSAEYRIREVNRRLLEQLAAAEPRGGAAGTLAPSMASGDADPAALNPFRGGLDAIRSIQDFWPIFVLIGCCLFVGDIAVRRIRWDFSGVKRLAAKRATKLQDADASKLQRLQTLRSIKQQAAGSAMQEPEPLAPPAASETPTVQTKPPTLGSDDAPEALSYTERLRQAKANARR
ncbi:VWA domain-containing protein [Rosistilla oblonga]|uniref:VWA domain-containing protein n=1 Tax=Rosistilla oblonga TaxID=2527990 RepID=UPI003A984E8F